MSKTYAWRLLVVTYLMKISFQISGHAYSDNAFWPVAVIIMGIMSTVLVFIWLFFAKDDGSE